VARANPKAAAPSGSSRRDRLASFEAARKKEQRRRTMGLLALCLVLALALLAYPVYLLVDEQRSRATDLADIGASLSAAGCDPAMETAATGNQEHVPEGTDVTYETTPPATGAHYDSPAPFTKRFYTTEDRPAVEALVHNLEHGYTIAWYRAGMSEDAKEQLEQISKTFAGDDYTQDKFIAAPWNEADGSFPDGKNIVLAHWYAEPQNPTDAAAQQGIRQACTEVSGEAVKEFMAKYPYTASPEPNGA
jgi:hypothetical protein